MGHLVRLHSGKGLRLSRHLAVLSLFVVTACGSEHADRAAAARLHVKNAVAALDKNDFVRALSAASLAVSYDPLDAKARDLLLRVRLTALATTPQAVRVDDAADLEYQAETMPVRDAAHANVYKTARAYFALARRDTKGAEALAREAVAAKGDWAPAHVALAQALLDGNKPVDASNEFEAALKADPANTQALLGEGKLATAKNEPDKAIPLLEKAAGLRDDAAVHLALGTAYWAKQRAREAGEQLQRATLLEPKNGDAHLQLGNFLYLTNQDEAAQREFQLANELGQQVQGTFGLAMVLARGKQYAQAARLFEAVAGADATLVGAIYQAGLARESAGERDAAVQLYRIFAQRAAQNPAESQRVQDANARAERLAQTPAPKAVAPAAAAPKAAKKP